MIIPRHHDRHAIERVVFVIEFDAIWDAAAFARADSFYQEHLKGEFPGRRISQRKAVQKQSDSSQMESLRFEKFRTDGKVASGICLEGEIVAVLRTEYEGWATVWTHETQPLIAQLIEACAEARSIVGLRLHYINEFSYEEGSAAFRADMVLRQGNSYVPPYVFERSGNWQCNTSFVDELKEPERLNLDHHLNFYVADETLESSEQKGTYLSIISDHGIAFPVPQAVDAFVKHDGACLGNFMNKLHDVHKGVIGQVLNDPIIAQIGLYS